MSRISQEPDCVIGAGVPTRGPTDHDNTGSGIATMRPTWRDHMRRWLGYTPRYPDVDADPKAAVMPGWFSMNTHVSLSLMDRLRLLPTGRLIVRSESRCDAVVETVIMKSETSIISPFDRRR